MSNKLFYSSPRARFFDDNGNPLTFGRVTFYEAGTSGNEKAVYTDSDNSIEAPNPMLLDAQGYVIDGGVWLGEGRYKFRLEKALVIPPDVEEDADFDVKWFIDNIEGSSVLNSGELSTIAVATIADLRALEVGIFSLVFVAGYWAVNDGGGGWFNYNASISESDNGGTVISPNGSPSLGRYLRNLENWETSVQYFGATSTSFLLHSNVVDSYVQNCLTWCLANNQTMIFPSDTYTFGSDQTYLGNLTIRIKENAVFNAEDASIELHFSSKNVAVDGVTNHRGTNVQLYLTPVVPTTFRPEHWGAVGDGSDNDADFVGFVNADGRYSDSTLILSGNYQPFNPSGSPTTTITTQKMHLVKGGSFNTDLNVKMGEYTFDDELNTFWLFDKLDLTTYEMNTLYLDHFTSVTALTDAQFIVFADNVTLNNTRHGTLKLLTGGSYEVGAIVAIPSYSLDLFIKTGNSIKATSSANLPRLLNNESDFAILDNSGSTIKLVGDKHSILWWGASSSTNSATTKLGITQAIASASLDSNRGWVTGGNENLSLTEVLTLTSVNVALNNLVLSSNADLSLTGTDISLNFCELGGFPINTISGVSVDLTNCVFDMTPDETLKVIATENLGYQNNNSSFGLFEFTTGSKSNVISNSKFKDLTKPNTTSLVNLVTINGGSNTSISGCSFDCENPSVPAIGDISMLHFQGTGESVQALSVKGNSFFNEIVSVLNNVSIFGVSGYASVGHYASINGNSMCSTLLPSEVLNYTPILGDTVTLNALSADPISPFTRIPFKGIFPFALNPTFVSASNTTGDATFTLGTAVAVGGAYEILVTITSTNYFKISCSALS